MISPVAPYSVVMYFLLHFWEKIVLIFLLSQKIIQDSLYQNWRSTRGNQCIHDVASNRNKVNVNTEYFMLLPSCILRSRMKVWTQQNIIDKDIWALSDSDNIFLPLKWFGQVMNRFTFLLFRLFCESVKQS